MMYQVSSSMKEIRIFIEGKFTAIVREGSFKMALDDPWYYYISSDMFSCSDSLGNFIKLRPTVFSSSSKFQEQEFNE